LPARSRRRLEWSARADRDLFDAWLFIAVDSPSTAEVVAGRIVDAAEQLPRYPLLGRPGRVTGTRELPVGRTPFTLIYRLRGNRVSIARVLHQRRRYP
jgi:plasmid stabilization system protein ParE